MQDVIDDYMAFKEDAERYLSWKLTANALYSDEILLIEKYITDKIIPENIWEMLLEEKNNSRV